MDQHAMDLTRRMPGHIRNNAAHVAERRRKTPRGGLTTRKSISEWLRPLPGGFLTTHFLAAAQHAAQNAQHCAKCAALRNISVKETISVW